MTLHAYTSIPVGIAALALALTNPLGNGAQPAGAASTQSPDFGIAVASPTASKPRLTKNARLALRSERTMKVAAKYEGVPYRRGGTTPHGFDCSGYTRHVFAKLGERLPRTSQQQYRQAKRVKHPRVGDLLFYHSGSRSGPVHHVAIYAGNDRVWHAPNPGTRVKKGKIYAKYVTAGRY